MNTAYGPQLEHLSQRIKAQQNNERTHQITEYERPQPVKVAQLLGQSGNLKTTQKDSVRKRMMPERLGVSSKKKNIQLTKKQQGMCQTVYSGKCVRRNLNFNEGSTNVQKKTDDQRKSTKLVTKESDFKKASQSTNRRSKLLPPNSIKERHLDKCTGKTSRCSKISETSQNSSLPKVIVINHDTCSENSTNSSAKSKRIPLPNKVKTVKGVVESSSPNSSIGSSQTPYIIKVESLIPVGHSTSHKVKANRENKDKSLESLCVDLQSTKLVERSDDANINHISSGMICINKEELIRLECNLKSYVSAAEDNISKLKSTLTCITRMLSTETKGVQPNTCSAEEKQEHLQLASANKEMLEKEVQGEICCKSTRLKKEDNKENCEDINAANCVMKISNTAVDGSFVELENELNIIHAKCLPTNQPIRQDTPVIKRCNKERANKSLREYMALKSSMNFLETPDVKRFRSLCPQDSLNKTHISSKILMDLHNLYSESPDS